ncbi:hypothetical protein J6590_013757 [Homalodisca vitripennis]|nr:hypothetical protein J6590_013757 [Homalodisca vitripennis]
MGYHHRKLSETDPASQILSSRHLRHAIQSHITAPLPSSPPPTVQYRYVIYKTVVLALDTCDTPYSPILQHLYHRHHHPLYSTEPLPSSPPPTVQYRYVIYKTVVLALDTCDTPYSPILQHLYHRHHHPLYSTAPLPSSPPPTVQYRYVIYKTVVLALDTCDTPYSPILQHLYHRHHHPLYSTGTSRHLRHAIQSHITEPLPSSPPPTVQYRYVIYKTVVLALDTCERHTYRYVIYKTVVVALDTCERHTVSYYSTSTIVTTTHCTVPCEQCKFRSVLFSHHPEYRMSAHNQLQFCTYAVTLIVIVQCEQCKFRSVLVSRHPEYRMSAHNQLQFCTYASNVVAALISMLALHPSPSLIPVSTVCEERCFINRQTKIWYRCHDTSSNNGCGIDIDVNNIPLLLSSQLARCVKLFHLSEQTNLSTDVSIHQVMVCGIDIDVSIASLSFSHPS